MNIQITDLPPGRQVKRILVDITFDAEPIPSHIIYNSEINHQSQEESMPTTKIPDIEVDKPSDIINIPNIDNTRIKKPIPDEMRDLEI